MADKTLVHTPMSEDQRRRTDAEVARWRRVLIGLGAALIVLTVVLELFAMFRGTTVTQDRTTPNRTVTTTDGAAVPTALITTCLGGAVLLFLGAAFYGRITKVSWNGVEVDLGPQAEKAVKDKADDVAKKVNQPGKAAELKALATEIAKGTNLVTSLDPDALAEASVGAAARQMKLL
jgi:HAMP domain-containing protein